MSNVWKWVHRRRREEDLTIAITECMERNEKIYSQYFRERDNMYIILSATDTVIRNTNIMHMAEFGGPFEYLDNMNELQTKLEKDEQYKLVLLNNETRVLKHTNPSRILLISKNDVVMSMRELSPKLREVHNHEQLILGGRYVSFFERGEK